MNGWTRPHTISILVLILLLLAGNPAHGAPTDASLFVFTIDDSRNKPNSCDGRFLHLLRFDFVDGELEKIDTILSYQGQPSSLECRKGGIHANRYLVSDVGYIVDLVGGEFLHRPDYGKGITLLKGVEGDLVVLEHRYHRQDGWHQEYYYFDLGNKDHGHLDEPGKWALPGELSPKGIRSVEAAHAMSERQIFENGSNIWLHELTGESRLLASGFRARTARHMSSFPSVPLLWLDEERVLTQCDTGEIVILHLYGTVEPVVTLDFTTKSDPDPRLAGLRGRFGGLLSRLPDGQIVYTVSRLPVPEGESFQVSYLIDIDGRTCEPYELRWRELGHGFAAELDLEKIDCRALYYKGVEIDTSRFLVNSARTATGYISIPHHEVKSGSPRAVKVWSASGRKWTTLDIPADHWLAHQAILGWIIPVPD